MKKSKQARNPTSGKGPVSKERGVLLGEGAGALVGPQDSEDPLLAVHPLDDARRWGLVKVLTQKLLETQLPPGFCGEVHGGVDCHGQRGRVCLSVKGEQRSV